MKNDCAGCEEDWYTMCEYVQQGYHIATTDDYIDSYPNGYGHYRLVVVDDTGKIIVE